MREPRWLTDDEQRVWQAYLRLNQDLSARLEQQLLRDGGLSGSDYKVLHPLSQAPDGLLRARDLGAEIGWDRSRLSHHLSRMEKRDLVAREECATDARGLMVRLTDHGRAAIEAAAPDHVAEVRRYFFDPLSDEERELLGDVFERLIGHLAGACVPAPSAGIAQSRRDSVDSDKEGSTQ